MKLLLDDKAIEMEIMDTFFKRLRGNMGKKKINTVLCFPKCSSIHTFFMKEKIDVIMTDKNHNILYLYPNLSKNKIIFPKLNVYYIYELPSNTNTYQLGEKVQFKI